MTRIPGRLHRGVSEFVEDHLKLSRLHAPCPMRYTFLVNLVNYLSFLLIILSLFKSLVFLSFILFTNIIFFNSEVFLKVISLIFFIIIKILSFTLKL
jgi:hypothetical protein